MKSFVCVLLASLWLLSSITSPATAQVAFKPIALTGEAGSALGLGPNLGPDVHFEEFNLAFSGGPYIDRYGEVAFTARLGTPEQLPNRQTLWKTNQGDLELVARNGPLGSDPRAGEDVYFLTFRDFIMGQGGQIAFKATLGGTGTPIGGGPLGIERLWAYDRGALNLVAKFGDPTPPPVSTEGYPNYPYTITQMEAPLISGNGDIVFLGRSSSVFGQGIWAYRDEELRSLVNVFAVTPEFGLGDDGRFIGINFFNAVNPHGEVTFRGSVGRMGDPDASGQMIWTNGGGAPHVVACVCAAGPGPNVGPDVSFSVLSVPVINGAGDIAFNGIARGDGVHDVGIWTNVDGTLKRIARQTDIAPGPDESLQFTFLNLARPEVVIGGSGIVAFHAEVRGRNADGNFFSTWGIWTYADGELAGLVYPGAEINSSRPGEEIFFTGASWGSVPLINASGDIAFLGGFNGTSSGGGLWLHRGGSFHEIIRVGDPFDVDPGPTVDERIILAVDMVRGSGGEDGRGTALNDDGTLVFTLRFTDGSSGIFTATIIPEPASIQVALLLCLSVTALRWRT